MSSLLEQAIIDAKMLKETARKNAEAQILEERAEEIKRKIEMLFEEEDPLAGLGGGDTTSSSLPTSEPAGSELKPEVKKVMDKIPPAYLGEGEEEIEINLDSLVQKVTKLEEEMSLQEITPHANIGVMSKDETQVEESTGEDVAEEKLEEDAATAAREATGYQEIAKAKTASAAEEKKKESEEAKETAAATTMAEEFTLNEEELEEELVMDMENVEEGGHNNFIKLKRQIDVEKALAAQGKLEEENAELAEALVEKANQASELEEQLDAAIAKLQETKEKLKKSVQLNVQLKEGVQMLTGKVYEVNLLNARLLYTNKTLRSSSLNERQKSQIAESVSRAKTVEEAKTIYETLQRTAGDVTEKRTAPQSLTEALNRSPGPFMPRKENPTADPVKARWQAIAGIKSKN